MTSCGEAIVALLSTPLDEMAACADTDQLTKLLEKVKQAQEQKPKVASLREESARKLERMFGEYGQAVAQLCRHLTLEKCTAKISRAKDRVQQTQFGNTLPASWAEVTLEATLKCTTRSKEHATFLLCSSVTTTHEHEEEEVDGVWYLLRGRLPRTGQWDIQTLWGNERNVQLTERMQQALGLELVQQLPVHVFAFAVMSAALALMQRVLPDNTALEHCGKRIRTDLQAEAYQTQPQLPRRNSLGNVLNATNAAPQYQQQNSSFATAPVAGPMWGGGGLIQQNQSSNSIQGGRAVSPQPAGASVLRSQSPGSQLVLAQQQGDGSGSPRSRQQQQQQQALAAAAAAQQQAQAVAAAQQGRIQGGVVNPQHAGTDPQQVRRPSGGAPIGAPSGSRPQQAQTLPMHPHAQMHAQMQHYQLPQRQPAGGGVQQGYMQVQGASPYSGQASPGWRAA